MLISTEDRTEKKRTEARTSGERLAYWLGHLTSPFIIGLSTFFSVSLATAPTATLGLLWIAIVGAGMAIPLLFIWWGVKKGHFSDVHISRRSQRREPLLVGLLCLAGMLSGLLWLHASRPLVATLVAVLVAFSLAAGITHLAKYKISFHVGSAAGAVTVCCLLISPICIALFPLVVLIAWARWKVEAHSPLQALAGAALAVGVTVTTFWLFGVR